MFVQKRKTSSKNKVQPPLMCYSGLNSNGCPRYCAEGQYCNGTACVMKKDCPCSVDNKVVKVSG